MAVATMVVQVSSLETQKLDTQEQVRLAVVDMGLSPETGETGLVARQRSALSLAANRAVECVARYDWHGANVAVGDAAKAVRELDRVGVVTADDFRSAVALDAWVRAEHAEVRTEIRRELERFANEPADAAAAFASPTRVMVKVAYIRPLASRAKRGRRLVRRASSASDPGPSEPPPGHPGSSRDVDGPTKAGVVE